MEQAAVAAWGSAWEALDALVDADGTAAHPHPRALRRPPRGRGLGPARELGRDVRAAPADDRRNLADAVHALLALHGTLPGLADEAARGAGGAVADWLRELAAGMARERDALVRLAAAAGPLPSTPGQAATDAAFAAQRHAFQMLARSDRAGVAAGAAAALALDWGAIRRVLARAADAYGAAPPAAALPDRAETATVLALAAETNAAERALLFGARALLEQHRAMWSLLAARASARAG